MENNTSTSKEREEMLKCLSYEVLSFFNISRNTRDKQYIAYHINPSSRAGQSTQIFPRAGGSRRELLVKKGSLTNKSVKSPRQGCSLRLTGTLLTGEAILRSLNVEFKNWFFRFDKLDTYLFASVGLSFSKQDKIKNIFLSRLQNLETPKASKGKKSTMA